MVAIKNIILFVTAVSSLAVQRRDASTILKDINTIDSDVKALTNAANTYNGGGIAKAVPVQNAEQQLDKDIQQGTKDAKATSQLSSADSKSIIAAIDNLRPDIQAAIKAIENKKSQFTSDGLKSTVQSDLNSLKSDTDDFANALIAIASSDQKTNANNEKSAIDGYFQEAINFYAN